MWSSLRRSPHRILGNFTTLMRMKTASFLICRILLQFMRKEACQVPVFRVEHPLATFKITFSRCFPSS